MLSFIISLNILLFSILIIEFSCAHCMKEFQFEVFIHFSIIDIAINNSGEEGFVYIAGSYMPSVSVEILQK